MVPLIEVEIDRVVVESILSTAHDSRPFEVGGVLLGSANRDNPRITNLIGPGPSSRATRVSFEPDYTYQQAELDRLFEEHGGNLAYFGDWHSHPRGNCSPSKTDVRTLLQISSATEAQCPDPVMIICGGRAGNVFRSFRLEGTAAREYQMRIVG
jgi:integrative and conjugative element protein (TIGR02256 family)